MAFVRLMRASVEDIRKLDVSKLMDDCENDNEKLSFDIFDAERVVLAAAEPPH